MKYSGTTNSRPTPNMQLWRLSVLQWISANRFNSHNHQLLNNHINHLGIIDTNGGSVYCDRRKLILPMGIVMEYPIANSVALTLLFQMIRRFIELAENNRVTTLRELYYYLRPLFMRLRDRFPEVRISLSSFLNRWHRIVLAAVNMPIHFMLITILGTKGIHTLPILNMTWTMISMTSLPGTTMHRTYAKCIYIQQSCLEVTYTLFFWFIFLLIEYISKYWQNIFFQKGQFVEANADGFLEATADIEENQILFGVSSSGLLTRQDMVDAYRSIHGAGNFKYILLNLLPLF